MKTGNVTNNTHGRFSFKFEGELTNCGFHRGIQPCGLLVRYWTHNPQQEEKDSNLCMSIYLTFIFLCLKKKKI